MKLTDLLPLEKWVELEKEIYEKAGLCSSVFDENGIRISDSKLWVNKLCPLIKANPKGQTYICSIAHQNAAAKARKTKEPVVEECDAGLAKIVSPIFHNGDFLGVAGGCGLLLEGSEVESFLINKLTEIDEEEIEALSKDIPALTATEADAVGRMIQKRLVELLA